MNQNHLKYFEGKVCTLITREINRNFKDEATAMGKPNLYPVNLIDHFMGRVLHADSASIVLQHPIIGTRSYFRTEHIVGIIEEQELDRNDPKNAKIIEELKNKNAPIPIPKITCPNGHTTNVPPEVTDGAEVICPICHVEFIASRTSSGWENTQLVNEKPAPESELVDIDFLTTLAQEAKDKI